MPLGQFTPAGEYRNRVTINRPVGTPSATGGTVEDDPEVFAEDIPAAIESTLGNEAIRAGGLAASASHLVKVRYLDGLKAWMGVVFESRELQILSIVDVQERHIEQQLLCAETQ